MLGIWEHDLYIEIHSNTQQYQWWFLLQEQMWSRNATCVNKRQELVYHRLGMEVNNSLKFSMQTPSSLQEAYNNIKKVEKYPKISNKPWKSRKKQDQSKG